MKFRVMLISLPVAKLIKKMGVTVFCLLTAHLGIKNKNVPYLERELRRKGWLLHFRASQVCAHNTKLHVSRYSSFQKNMGLLNPVYSLAINSFPVPPSFPQINLIPRVSNADSVISSLSSSFPPRRLLVFRHTGRKRCPPRPEGLWRLALPPGLHGIFEQAVSWHFCICVACFRLECLPGPGVSVCSFG